MRWPTARPRPGHPYFAGAPLLIAHRGGSELAPENTLLAFRRAVEWWRADILEIDVQPTRDGEAVVIHDATVDRTTEGSGRVADLLLDDLQAFDAGFRFSPDAGRTFPFRGRNVRIPTLREVLTALPDTRINIEIKDPHAQRRVRETLGELRAPGRVLVASERRASRVEFRSYTGPISASKIELFTFLLLLHAGAAPLFPFGIDVFQMPERYGGRQVLSSRWIERAHAFNIPVHVWTVNDTAEMRRLLARGVDGIMTDRPDRLARVLHEDFGRPMPPGAPPPRNVEYDSG